MNTLTFYTDKKNNFKYKLSVEGENANLANTTSKLCLEFKNGLNIYIKSKINATTGQCIANFPSLEFLGETDGKLRIETIANKTYFKLYESAFKLKDSIKVNVEVVNEVIEEDIEEPEINFGIQIDERNFKEEKEKPIVEEETVVEKEIKPKKKRNKKDIKQIINEETQMKKSSKTLKSFSEWQTK